MTEPNAATQLHISALPINGAHALATAMFAVLNGANMCSNVSADGKF